MTITKIQHLVWILLYEIVRVSNEYEEASDYDQNSFETTRERVQYV